nr:MAG TPA: hypothetical protein [Caudoviricetes sp.]
MYCFCYCFLACLFWCNAVEVVIFLTVSVFVKCFASITCCCDCKLCPRVNVWG